MNKGIIEIIPLAKDQNIVLDTNSSSIHIFDDIAIDLLKKYQKTPLNDKEFYYEASDFEKELLDEIFLLKEKGSLFSQSVEKKDIHLNSELKSICLNVSHTCNLACPYCFAKGGNYNDKSLLMKLDVALAAIDFLILKSGNKKLLEVDFFGGEPLLNFDVVKKTIEYGNKKAKEANKAIKWALTTNGYALTKDISDFLVANNVGCVLSIDGREEIHNRFRYTTTKENSYQKVLENFKYFISISEDYVARGTYTAYNIDFYNDVEALINEGFKHISIEPVVVSTDVPYALTKDHLAEIEESYKKIRSMYLDAYLSKKPFDYFHFNVSLQGGPCIQKRITNCGASYEYMAITPSGEIHPCHQLIENTNYNLGKLDINNIENTKINKDIAESFKEAHVLNKNKCTDCFAKFHCSGGCHANNINYAKDIFKPYDISCDIQKIILHEAIKTQVMLSLLDISKMQNNDDITKNKIKNSLEVQE